MKYKLILLFGILLAVSLVRADLASDLDILGDDMPIKILNIQSYPVVGGSWITNFQTLGEADLKITPFNGTLFEKDLEFTSLKCGDKIIEPTELTDLYVKFDNYYCFSESYFEVKVISSGVHTIRFEFGSEVGYSYNNASLKNIEKVKSFGTGKIGGITYDVIKTKENNKSIYKLEMPDITIKTPVHTTCYWGKDTLRYCVQDVNIDLTDSKTSFSTASFGLEHKKDEFVKLQDIDKFSNFKVNQLNKTTTRISFDYPPNMGEEWNLTFDDGNMNFKIDPEISACSILNESGTYLLTADIINSTGDPCMDFNVNNTILDCQGYLIDSNLGGNANGIDIIEKNNITVRDCSISEWSLGGIYVYDSYNISILNNTVYSNTARGIAIITSYNVNVLNNKLYSSVIGRGIYVSSNSYNNTISNNEIYSNDADGIYIDDSTDNIISNNNIYSNGDNEIELYEAEDNIFTNNIINGTSAFYSTLTYNINISNNFLTGTLHFDYSEPGSCPYLYTWDGTDFELGVDIYPAGKFATRYALGILKPQPTDYYLIQKEDLKARDGVYDIRLVEERNEIDYFDKVELYMIEHPENVKIYPDASTLYNGVPDMQLHIINETFLPISCITDTGEDCLEEILTIDNNLVSLGEQEYLDWHYIEVDFGEIQGDTELITYGYSVWPLTKEGLAMRGNFIKKSGIEIWNGSEWLNVSKFLSYPKELSRFHPLTISGISSDNHYKLRLKWVHQTVLDSVFIGTSTDDEKIKIKKLKLDSAELGYYGTSIRTDDESPFGLIYNDERQNTINSAFSGNFTRYGNIKPLLLEEDDKFVIFNYGDEVRLEFKERNTNKDYDFILYSYGYYKDKKALWHPDIITTVEPLPFKEMSSYPYLDNESYPYDEEHIEYLGIYNTREYIKTEPEHHTIYVYNNFINTSTVEITDLAGLIFFNISNQTGTRIYGDGIYIGGNAWFNSTGGYYYDCVDSNTDGFCDASFDVVGDASFYDNLPLSDEYVPADTCTCAGLDTDWEIDMSDYCNITSDCNLGTGYLNFTGSGETRCNATINTTSMGDPGANGILYIQDSCIIYIRS